MWPSGAGAPPWSPGSSRDTHRGSPGPVAGQRFLEGAMRVADTRSIQRTGTGPRFAYPISLDVAGRRAVVVGAGAVALGKGDALLDAGALLTVVADGPPEALERLERAGATIARRGFDPADLDGAFLCVASSDDPEQRAAIFAEARARGELVIAVSTGGRSPALASRLRRLLEERFGPEWEELLALLGEVREQTLPLLPDVGERSRRWRQALALEELEELARAGRLEQARERLLDRLVGPREPSP